MFTGQIISLENGWRPDPGQRVVYFVQAETLGLIKIGFATNVRQRIATMQCGSPDKLKLLGVWHVDDAPMFESHFHEMFAHLRTHGEWFRPDDQLREFVAECLFTVDEGHLRYCWGAAAPKDGEFSMHGTANETPEEFSERFCDAARAHGYTVEA